MFGRKKDAVTEQVDPALDQQRDPLADIPKTKWQRAMPVIACGSGLFSDGYINNVCHPQSPY